MATDRKLGARRPMNLTNVSTVPKSPGIYLVRNKPGDVKYVGMTKTLKTRIEQHVSQKDIPGAHSFQIRITKSAKQAETLEGNYIKRYKPTYNIQKNK